MMQIIEKSENLRKKYGSVILGCAAFLLVAIGFRAGGFQGDIVGVLVQCCAAAAAYTLIYLAVFSLSPWKLSLCWLGIPLLIFSVSWLRWYWAITLTLILIFALYSTSQSDNNTQYKWNRSRNEFAWGAIIILGWVYFSGAGGYGFQTADYVMHNGRLEDLINYSWPVFYQRDLVSGRADVFLDRNLLVTYSGYYLPAALIGKIFDLRCAFEFMHFWTLFGCWLAYRWCLEFVSVKSTLLVALVFVMFGGWDIAGPLLSWIEISSQIAASDKAGLLAIMIKPDGSPDWLDFGLNSIVNPDYFFGNFVSITASFFWAPHQSIAGWVAVALLLAAWKNKNTRQVAFVFSLLAIWSPLIMIGLIFFPLWMFFQNGIINFRNFFSFENIVAGGLIVLVVGSYYFSASADSNPMSFVFSYSGAKIFLPLLLFHFIGWGVYAAAIYPQIVKMDQYLKDSFYVICITFLSLSLFRYGTYNDLMIRSSAPLMFGMAILVMNSLGLLLKKKRIKTAFMLLVLLLPGFFSFGFNVYNSMVNYDAKTHGESVVNYGGGWQFLGSQESWYVRVFSAPP